MGFTKEANKLLTNKYFLYVIVFLAITNILGYLVTNRLNAVCFFILIGVLTHHFSKNMAVVLLVALIATNFLMANTKTREGMDNASDADDVIDKVSSIDPEMATAATALKSEGNVDAAKKKLKDKKDNATITAPTDPSNPDLNKAVTEDGAPSGVEYSGKAKGAKSENFNGNRLKGTPVDSSSSRIDYASTMETAYDNLDKILGSESIGKLTKDTEKLMNNQQKLFDTMQTMAPALENAKKMLKDFDISSLGDLAKFGQGLNSATNS